MQTTSSTTPSHLIWTGAFTAEYQAFRIEFNGCSATNRIQIDATNHAYSPTTAKVINDGNWHAVTVTYDGTTVIVYVDGVLDSSTTTWNVGGSATLASTVNTNGNNILLGGSNYHKCCYYTGKLSNVQFYNKVIAPIPAIAPTYKPTAVPSSITPTTITPTTITPTTISTTITPTTILTSLPTLVRTEVIPSTQLPKCAVGWTLHCSCLWTDKNNLAYQDSSPVDIDPMSWDSFYHRIEGSLVTLMVVAALYACTRSVKDLTHRTEYTPIFDREKI